LLAKLAELHPENDFMIEHDLLRFDLFTHDRGVLYLMFETSRGVRESQTSHCVLYLLHTIDKRSGERELEECYGLKSRSVTLPSTSQLRDLIWCVV